MKYTLILFFSLTTLTSTLAQSENSKLALNLLKLFSDSKEKVLFEFNDPLHYQWRRTPGKRNGIALYQMNLEQKKILHKMLSNALSSSGYSKVTHVLFNEDLSKEFDPQTGQNKYWFAVYGTPSQDSDWGWRLEGHHLSLNFSFFGDKLIAITPFVLGSFPAIIEKDTVRAGFRNLPGEIDYGFELIEKLDKLEQQKAIISDVKPKNQLMSESGDISLKIPIGLSYKNLNDKKQTLIRKLVQEYIDNTKLEINIDYSQIYFAWWGKIDNPDTYRYRIHGKEILIELENIGNHIHCVFRMLKTDFGSNPHNN